MTALAERLGAAPTDRLLIVSADSLGSCHAANAAVFTALRTGVASTATLAVPCPWARHAAAAYRGEDVGVHLTLNAQLELFRWGPITHAPSLLDGDGGFPRTVDDLWDHADLDEVRREVRSQLERAVLWGLNVSHLSTHLNALQARPEFFDVYLDIACEYRLPIRLEGADAHDAVGFPFRDVAADEGVLAPDYFTHSRYTDIDRLIAIVENLEPGVTEIHLEPANDSDELRAFDPMARHRVTAASALEAGSPLAQAIEASNAQLIGYEAIKTAMRAQ